MVVRGENLGGDPWIDQPTGWGSSRESLFLKSSGIHPTLLGQCKGLPRTACHERVRVMCIRFLLQDVQLFKSPRLLNMSNRLFVVINT
jgi:hypothetical protein